MLLLFFIVASFLSAHNHQDLEKYILNACSFPNTASRIVKSPSSFHRRCEKALKKAEEGLDGASALELKKMKDDAKKAEKHLENEIKYAEDYGKPITVSTLTTVGTVGTAGFIASAANAFINEKKDSMLFQAYSIGAVACGALTLWVWSYSQNKWIAALKANEKSVDHFKDKLKERYKDKKH